MIWYFENPERFRQERGALERLASSSAWLLPGEWRVDESLRVLCDADIVTSSRTYPVTIQYPNHYPHSPPLVLPRGSSERWSAHQYGPGGELCLEFGPDNWHPELTGADMIASAYRLLQGETRSPGQQAIVPSRHATTLGQDLHRRYLRLLVTRELHDIVASLPERAVVKANVLSMHHEESAVFVITSLVLPDGTQWADPTIPKPIKCEGYERQMVVVRWPADLKLPLAESAQALRDAVGASEALTPDIPFLSIVRGTTVYTHRVWDDGTISEIFAIPPQPAAARMDDSHAALVARKVAIVGCGSLGSKLAVMLARSGVGRFLLIDDDIMLPDNLIRQELDWRELGAHKAAAVSRSIQLVNPRAECHTRLHRMGGQEASGSIETLITSLAECDLIVDATADARAFGYLCAAASAGGKPVVWAEVFGGGFGGLIARHRPLLDPDPASMRRTIENWCAAQGTPPVTRGHNYETGGSGPPLIADDADVTVIAAHAARLTIDTLIPRNPSSFPYSVYMIGLARGWIFDQPFDTRPIDVGPPPSPTSATPVDQQLFEEEMAIVFELFKKRSNATASDTGNHSAPAT
jgi:molybdopterin/thiamine biosynthesis adenylyltransferase